MTTTPTLPPLPPPEILELGGKTTGYYTSTTKKLREAAYQAGRDAGLEEAAIVGGHEAEKCLNFPDGQRVADVIRALKSDAKGGV